MSNPAQPLVDAIRAELSDRGWTITHMIEQAEGAPLEEPPHPRTIWRLVAGETTNPQGPTLLAVEHALGWASGRCQRIMEGRDEGGEELAKTLAQRVEALEDDVAYLLRRLGRT